MPTVFAIAPPGLEPVVARELVDHGHRPEVGAGHVLVRVDTPAKAATLASQLHTPSRLLLELARGQASTLDQLARLVRGVDWSPFLHRRTPIKVSVVARKARIRRKDIAAKKVEHALADVQRAMRSTGKAPRKPVEQHIRVKLDGNKATVSIDVGGDLLHKRGWRQSVGKAPLRETLAASLLILAGWSGDEPLLDPFSGAGTFTIEAGLLAAGRSPFVGRTLACAQWPVADRLSPARGVAPVLSLHASDRSEQAVAHTRDNAQRAGVSVSARVCDVAQLTAPAPAGLLIANPPYGARLGQSEDTVRGVYKALGRALRGPLSGWRALFLAPSPGLARAVDRSAFQITSFSNGSRTVGAYGLDPAEERGE